MKWLSRWLRGFIITILILGLARGLLYRLTVSYSIVGTRPVMDVHHIDLIKFSENQELDTSSLPHLISPALQLTAKQLSFTTKTASNNPNVLMDNARANCIGYAALFSSTLTKQTNLMANGRYEIQHLIGKIRFLGIDVHSYINHPFFRDHDFVSVQDTRTGKVIYIDPSLWDYLYIKRVRVRSDS
ncbi:MAG: hypothetical protein JJ975_10275 [Bacteroidia bacterium]|nr:hypothetical protein [Bacteroidia bacterium]